MFQVNQKPLLSSAPTKSLITSSNIGGDGCMLTLTGISDHEQSTYTGTQQRSTNCVLIFSPETQSYILDKVDVDFNFNLDSAVPDLLSEDEPLAAEHVLADPDNPFDYRHYLKRRLSSSPEPIELPSRAPSPLPKVRTKLKSKPKPRKRASRPPVERTPSPLPREEVDADNEESDDGGLLIIMDPSSKPRPPRFNINRGGEAPRSLRSAASSTSPAVGPHISSSLDSDDMDVKLDLPSPEKATVVDMSGAEVVEDDDEDDAELGDLEAELERELGKDEDMGGVELPKYVAESSSESEEE